MKKKPNRKSFVETIARWEEQTDEETYQILKKWHKENPQEFMNPKKWKKLRLIQLKKEGKTWSS